MKRDAIGADHLDQRVSLRWHDTDGQPTETLGYLREVTEATLVVERRDGEHVEVPRDRITASRVVPGAPPPKRGRS